MDVSELKALLKAAAKGTAVEDKVIDASKVFASKQKAVKDMTLREYQDKFGFEQPPVVTPEQLLGRKPKTTTAKEINDAFGAPGTHDTGMSQEDQAYNDMVSAAKEQGQDPRKFSGAFMADKAVVGLQPKLSANAPVKVTHPFNPKEVFQFPPGTDEKTAKDLVRQIILKRVREGEEKIDLPSNLPGEKPPIDTSEK